MSGVVAPVRRLLSGTSSTARLSNQGCRAFHASASLSKRARPGRKNKEPVLLPYTQKDQAVLDDVYTPEQRKIIELGEQAIDNKDLLKQGRFRLDPYYMRNLDDFAQTRSIVDRNTRKDDWSEEDLKPRDMEEWEDWIERNPKNKHAEEARRNAMENLDRWAQKQGFKNRREMWMKECKEQRQDPDLVNDPMIDQLNMGLHMLDATALSSQMAPGLGKVKQEKGAFVKEEEPDEKDPEGIYTRLRKVTGLKLDEILELRSKVLVRHRVVNQTRLGKVASTYVLCAAGNKQGMLGIGEGKATEPDEAVVKARFQAFKSMKPIPRYEDRTIFGEVESKVSASVVKLMARPPGFGIRCQHNIFEMARLCGIQDLAARVPRSRNKMNTIKATFKALTTQRLPEDIARGLGKKLVDVRKVYYGGDQKLPQSWYAFNKNERDRRDKGRVLKR